jgi:hypothetical protein
MATQANLIATYQSNPTLQNRYTQQEYLDMFGFGSTPTQTNTSMPTNTNTTTPATTGVQSIIGQNLNQGGGGGGGGITTLDPYSRPQGTPLDPNSFLGKTIQGVKDFGTSVFDKFSGSKVGEGITEGATKFKNFAITPMMALANMRNPLNPSAQNYNPSLQGQIDMLEGMTGTKITGTSNNLKFTDDQMMIGRDPNSGLAKYGPGSVLEGQNVISGFGTNDYIGQLDKYIEKMKSYATLSKFQQAKLDRAIAEKKAAEEKAMLEEIAREEEKARVAGVQRSLDRGSYVDRDSGGYSASDRAVGGGREATNAQGQNAAEATAAGTGTSQGYSQHYNDGGRVYLYHRLK